MDVETRDQSDMRVASIPESSPPGGRLLRVDGEPFLVLGAELHNSSSGTEASIERAFTAIQGRSVNTVLAAVTWEQLEPEEGQFDFALIDALLERARSHSVRLIPLWFGAWKNGQSSYVPAWVKRDTVRFPRAVLHDGRISEHLSPFAAPTTDADVKAFAALMQHLSRTDDGTVIMVQVENEVGLLGSSRDHSDAADAAHDALVPTAVIDALVAGELPELAAAWSAFGNQRAASWTDTFGESSISDEVFMASGYASHLEQVARTGRREHPVPLFTNAWLDAAEAQPGFALAGGQQPGEYPSGGPLRQVFGVWRRLAPSLDFVAPDIYFGDFDDTCAVYGDYSGTLFIPEMRRDATGANDVYVAIGQHRAIGVSPFGMDSLTTTDGLEMADTYALVGAVASLLEDHPTVGFHLRGPQATVCRELGGHRFEITRLPASGSGGASSSAAGLIVQLNADRFVSIGRGFTIAPISVNGSVTGILRAEELEGSYPEPVVTRVLNGDETHTGAAIVHPPIRSSATAVIPSLDERSGIVRFELYTL